METAISPDVQDRASTVLREIRKRMYRQVALDVQQAFALLDSDLSAQTEIAIEAALGPDAIHSFGLNPLFVRFAPPLYLVDLLAGWPEAFMGGAMFTAAYDPVAADTTSRLNLARVMGYLNDLAILCTSSSRHSGTELRRFELSLELLEQELAPDSW